MADSKFFLTPAPITLRDIAKKSGATLIGNGDQTINDVAPLDTAKDDELSFLDNIKYKGHFAKTKAGACFIHPDMQSLAPKGVNLLLTPKPYKAYAQTAQIFYPDPKPEASISPHAIIHPDALIGKNCVIEAGAIIKSNASIADGCWIEENAVIGQGVKLGEQVRIGVNATLSHCEIGAHSRIYTGARIGQDGFGFAIDPSGFVKVPQLGRVIIAEHVEIGANTTIDRGAGPDTTIGQGTWIDNLVQIGHNVKIGKGCIIVSQVGISGSTVIGDYVALGGQVGVAGHLNIGTGAQVAAQSGIMRDIPAGESQMGYPAMPMKQFMKQVAYLKRLIKNNKSVD